MQYIAYGRIQPERAAVFFEEVKLDFSGKGYLRVKCDAGQLTAIFDWDGNDVVGAKLTIEHFAQMIASSLGFSLNCGYSVELISVHQVGSEGGPYTFGVKAPNDAPEDQLLVFNDALLFAVKNVYFRLALRDYMRAITDQHDCAFYCFRTLEAISKSFSSKPGVNGWDEMHSALGSCKDDIISKIKNYADPVRHGNWVEAPDLNNAQRKDMLGYTQSILMAFLKYGS